MRPLRRTRRGRNYVSSRAVLHHAYLNVVAPSRRARARCSGLGGAIGTWGREPNAGFRQPSHPSRDRLHPGMATALLAAPLRLPLAGSRPTCVLLGGLAVSPWSPQQSTAAGALIDLRPAGGVVEGFALGAAELWHPLRELSLPASNLPQTRLAGTLSGGGSALNGSSNSASRVSPPRGGPRRSHQRRIAAGRLIA